MVRNDRKATKSSSWDQLVLMSAKKQELRICKRHLSLGKAQKMPKTRQIQTWNLFWQYQSPKHINHRPNPSNENNNKKITMNNQRKISQREPEQTVVQQKRTMLLRNLKMLSYFELFSKIDHRSAPWRGCHRLSILSIYKINIACLLPTNKNGFASKRSEKRCFKTIVLAQTLETP